MRDARNYVKKKFSHLQNGEVYGPPPERVEDPLDGIVEGIIDALRAETRLYPDLYAWIISDAVREHLGKKKK